MPSWHLVQRPRVEAEEVDPDPVVEEAPLGEHHQLAVHLIQTDARRDEHDRLPRAREVAVHVRQVKNIER